MEFNGWVWQIPWKFQGPQRVGFFIWMTLKDRLLTNVERMKRGLGDNSACGICGHNIEDALHVIGDCYTAKIIWTQVVPVKTILFRRLEGVVRNWIQMYMDGAIKADSGFTYAGGVMRDRNGKQTLGFNWYPGTCLVLEAKL
ncbi:hypothetical protein Gohar_016475 [Gossypium harknessii]|uniref:Reverse transcriptase zinc-binding domain-containing protein n=1 Tax=Gossypium harknessii TaxID=34285 RepID=A0A7J9G478_9ROSI|nr:hypothetical protein [Gossypium harknessii]